MAAHSDAVSLPVGDADELPRTMVTPFVAFTGIVAKDSQGAQFNLLHGTSGATA